MTAIMKSKAEDRLALSAAIRRLYRGSFRVEVTDDGTTVTGDLIRFYEVTLHTDGGDEVFGSDDPRDVVAEVAAWLTR